MFFGQSEATATQVAALIMSGASVIAYIVGEGMIDAASAGADVFVEEPVHPPEED